MISQAPMEFSEMEEALQQAMIDKALAQGKFEIAANILHEIGNEVVGLGSYLTRIQRTMEQNDPKKLLNLAGFFAIRQDIIGAAIGDEKAGTMVRMLHNMVKSQHAIREEIQKSITEQLSIITHVQEILNIQRQYVAGHETR